MQLNTLSFSKAVAGRACYNWGWTDRKLDSGMRGLLLASFLAATPGVPRDAARRGRGHAPGARLHGLACVLLAGCEVLALGTHDSPSSARFLPVSEALFLLPQVAQTCPLAFLVLFFRAGFQNSPLAFPSPALTVTRSVSPWDSWCGPAGSRGGHCALPHPMLGLPLAGFPGGGGGCGHCKVLSRPSAARCQGRPVIPCRGECNAVPFYTARP